MTTDMNSQKNTRNDAMNATIPMLLFVSAVATGFAPQNAVQEARRAKEPGAAARPGSRVPVDISLVGLGPSMLPLTTTTSCLDSIKDRATGGCLEASSKPHAGAALSAAPRWRRQQRLQRRGLVHRRRSQEPCVRALSTRSDN